MHFCRRSKYSCIQLTSWGKKEATKILQSLYSGTFTVKLFALSITHQAACQKEQWHYIFCSSSMGGEQHYIYQQYDTGTFVQIQRNQLVATEWTILEDLQILSNLSRSLHFTCLNSWKYMYAKMHVLRIKHIILYQVDLCLKALLELNQI